MTCGNCGSALATGGAFCGRCGVRLMAAPVPAVVATSPAPAYATPRVEAPAASDASGCVGRMVIIAIILAIAAALFGVRSERAGSPARTRHVSQEREHTAD